MYLLAILAFHWTCPHCHETCQGKAPHTANYINAHCGHCGHWTMLDYHRSTDAPEAAVKLDNLALGSRNSPAPKFDSPPIKSAIFNQSKR
jgi:hypothetical protein